MQRRSEFLIKIGTLNIIFAIVMGLISTGVLMGKWNIENLRYQEGWGGEKVAEKVTLDQKTVEELLRDNKEFKNDVKELAESKKSGKGKSSVLSLAEEVMRRIGEN